MVGATGGGHTDGSYVQSRGLEGIMGGSSGSKKSWSQQHSWSSGTSGGSLSAPVGGSVAGCAGGSCGGSGSDCNAASCPRLRCRNSYTPPGQCCPICPTGGKSGGSSGGCMFGCKVKY
ncbi:hypothetical protein MAR_030735 [Mya arenaria]|uniref:Uncharacterized protein n=1 Tax=Mya arenaria TaxID=6604 RepID=A0ABY7F523_MYAAR|nr:hypothetical protein MAR_030735 [Mya arenaria]